MRASRPCPWALLLLCAAGSASAATTLLDGWQAAMAHDPDYRAAAAARAAGAQDAARGRALLLPGLQASGAVGRSSIDSVTRGAEFSAPGFGSSTGVEFATDISQGRATRWSLSAQQPLYDAGRFADAAQLRNAAQISALRFTGSEQQLRLNVARRYFDVLQTRDAADTSRQLLQATQRARDEATARFETGDASTLDRNDAQARLDALNAELLAAANAQLQAESAWSDLTGLDAADITALPDAAALATAGLEPLADWQQRALQHPALRMQELAVDSAAREAGRYGSLNGLRVELVAGIGHDRLDGDGDYGRAHVSTDTTQIGVQASLPLFTGGLRSAQRAQARALAQQSQAQRDAAQLDVTAQVRTAWQGLNLAAARLTALEQALRSAQARLDATRIGVDSGERSTLELLDAEADLAGTRSQWRAGRYEWLYGRLRLAAAAGVLADTDLRAADAALADSARPQRNP